MTLSQPYALALWLVETYQLFGAKQYVHRLLDTPDGKGVNPNVPGCGWPREIWLAVSTILEQCDPRQNTDRIARSIQFKGTRPWPAKTVEVQQMERVCKCGHPELDHTGKTFNYKCTDCSCETFQLQFGACP